MKTPLFPAGFLRYATMNILGMLGISCYILADTFFVARATGADGLAALNLAIPFYSFIHGAGLMVGIGGATRYSLLVGGGRDGQATRPARGSWWASGSSASTAAARSGSVRVNRTAPEERSRQSAAMRRTWSTVLTSQSTASG